jgi:hypothetical protein
MIHDKMAPFYLRTTGSTSTAIGLACRETPQAAINFTTNREIWKSA